MKRLIYIFALCAFVAACGKQVPEQLTEHPEPHPEKVELTVGLPSAPETKVTEDKIADDNKVNSLQVFIFNAADGTLDSYASNSTGEALTLACTTGLKNIYALVNCKDMKSVSDENILNARTIGYREINPANMFMSGFRKNVEITANTGSITIDVSNKVARIRLKSVTNAITIPQFRDEDFQMTKAYLVNIPSEMKMIGRPDPSSYRIKWENLGCEHLLEETCWHEFSGDSGMIAPDATYTESIYFYTFENWSQTDCEDGSPDTAPRYTRLVVQARIGTETYFYPVSIPGLEPGKTYDVSLTVTRPGSKDPDKGISKENAGVSIVVKEWSSGKAFTETI